MLGLVIAGNIAMVFVFWELVGICSYFLIGFYIERKSASNAANKAFIVNRVGDFGMIIGLMALFGSLGTFAFGDVEHVADGKTVTEPGIFSQVRTEANDYALQAPDGMVKAAAAAEIAKGVQPTAEQIQTWRAEMEPGQPGHQCVLAAGGRRPGHLLRLRRQERPVSAARLAARRHGRPHAGLAPWSTRPRWSPPACIWSAASIRCSRPKCCW